MKLLKVKKNNNKENYDNYERYTENFNLKIDCKLKCIQNKNTKNVYIDIHRYT